VQRTFDSRFGFGLGFFLFGHQHLLGRIHHVADGFGFSQGLAAALFQFTGASSFFVSAGFGFGSSFGCGFFAGTLFCVGLFCGFTRSGVFCWRYCRRFGRRSSCVQAGGFSTGTGFAFFAGERAVCSRCFGRCIGSSLLGGALCSLGFCPLAGFGFFALATLFRQFFFLTADQFGLTASLFLTAGQLGMVKHWFGRFCCPCGGHRFVIAFDEGALFAHFHLDGTGFAGGIGLLDFGGGLFGQGNLLALTCARAMAGLQVGQQLLLVNLAQGVRRRRFGNTCRAQLLKQGFGGFFEFSGELGDSGTGHICFKPPSNQAWPAVNQCSRAFMIRAVASSAL
jgi:hypothetical protein